MLQDARGPVFQREGKPMMEKTGRTLRRMFVPAVLAVALAACGGSYLPRPTAGHPSPLPPEGHNISPPPTRTESWTPSPIATPSPTVNSLAQPSFSYPLKPGPVINRENAKRVIRLGIIPIESLGGIIGSQMAWSPDGSRLAVTTNGEGIRIIDPLAMIEIGEIWRNVEGMADAPGGIASSPDGTMIAVSLPDDESDHPWKIVFFDTQTFAKVREDIPSNIGYVLSFSHHGKWLAYGSQWGGEVINLEDNSQIYQFVADENADFDSVVFSWDDRYFTASANGHTPGLVHTGSWKVERELSGSICFAPDGERIAMTPVIWSLEDFQLTTNMGDDFGVGLCDFGMQNDILINFDLCLGIGIWDADTGGLLNFLVPMDGCGTFYNVSLSPDGKFIAVIDRLKKVLSIWGIPAE
jgi:WD40 repeat protein